MDKEHYKEIHDSLITEYERLRREVAVSDDIDQPLICMLSCLHAYLTVLELYYTEDKDG